MSDELELARKFEGALAAQGKEKYAEAMDLYTEVLIHKPDLSMAWNNRGIILSHLGHPFDAILNYDRAILHDGTKPEYYNNRGAAEFEQKQWEKSLADYDNALKLKPSFTHAHLNKGNVYARICQPEKAIEAYRSSIKADFTYVDAHLGLAFMLLEQGQFEEGWKEFEWRWKSNQMVVRGLEYPEWEGEPAKNPTDALLLYTEQGYGDALQFMRYVEMAKKLWGGKVYLEVKLALSRIAKSLKGVDKVVIIGEPLPKDITTCSPIQSCPRIMGTTVETIPGKCPYLFADSYRANIWKKRLEVLPPGLLVGLCWSGMKREHQMVANAIDKRRSMQLAQFAPLAKIKGISWVSLQKGPPADQIKAPPSGMTIGDWTDDLEDFYDTAALIECLDLVISVDTAVPHLSAAMNKPTWMLSRYDGCWRWMGKRKDSPWYPTLRLFHQPSDENWEIPVNEAAEELKILVEHKNKLAA